MSAATKLDALHAEMLGDLQELFVLVKQFRADMPALLAGLRGDAAEAAATVTKSCEDFHGMSLALAEFIKLRKTEVLEDIEKSTMRNALTMQTALATFARSFLVLGVIGGLNLLALLALLFK